MRGSDAVTGSLFSYVDLEDRVPAKHPLRMIRAIVNEVLASLDADFAAMYSDIGRELIPPERLLRGSLIQAFYTVRSERQLMEQLNYNLLFRWFVGLGIDDPVWDHSTYSKNRDRLLEADVARKFLKAILAHGQVAPLLSDDHFTVDGTLIQAWASIKSFVPKEPGPAASGEPGDAPPSPPSGAPPGPPAPSTETAPSTPRATPMTTTETTPPEPAATSRYDQEAEASAVRQGRNEAVDFHGQKRGNATHVSTTDSQARLYKKGKGAAAKLAYIGHALAENRHGLIVETETTQATGTAECEAAKTLVDAHAPGSERQLTLGADKAYDTAALVTSLREKCVTPHVAQNNKGRRSAIDGRTTRHPGYAQSQKKRKLIEEAFGWAKSYGGLARPMRHGRARMGFAFTFAMAAYDLIRLPRLLADATT